MVIISAVPKPIVITNINVWLLGRYRLDNPCRQVNELLTGKYFRVSQVINFANAASIPNDKSKTRVKINALFQDPVAGM